MPPEELKVLSFNVWGLRFVSKDRVPRMKAIAQYLANSDFDVVCLQEIWIHDDFLMVKKEVAGVLPNARFFHTGALGSGLAILTRLPIISSTTLPYSLSGLPLHVIAGDFFVNKAAGSVVLLHPELGELEVWSTHMHAAGEGGPETNRAHRLAQAWELSRAVRAAAERGRYVIACGDFNSLPQSLPMSILSSVASLTDSWLSCNALPSSPTSSYHPDPLLPDAEDAIRLHGVTCDSPLNTYSAGKPLTGDAIRWKGKRLDYILFRGPEVVPRRSLIWAARQLVGEGSDGDHEEMQIRGDGTAHEASRELGPARLASAQGGEIASSENGDLPSSTTLIDTTDHDSKRPRELDLGHRPQRAPRLRCVRSEVVLTGIVPGERFSYSDHFPLLSVFRVDRPGGRGKSARLSDGDRQRTLGSGMGEPVSREQAEDKSRTSGQLFSFDREDDLQAQATTGPDFPLTDPAVKIEHLSSVLQILQDYTTISQRTGKTHLRLFAASIVLALALTISSAWQPKSWIQPIWTLLGVATGAIGATMLYVGFVWGRWEEGLLREVMEEMEMELRLVRQEA